MESKPLRLLLAAPAALLPPAVGFLFYRDPPALLFFPCPFHQVTGFDCPGCGMSRAAVCLLRLQFARAFRLNPFVFPMAALLLLLWGLLLRWVFTGKIPRLGEKPVLWATSLFVAAFVAFGILRNVPVWPFSFFKV